ncbi:protein TALPID3 isoform X6 [Epinephelus moara]|uniref:protein TALPID3 isoform X6 n=1 Tax=Epinephelus moara TaxID=300413 RepID=UPI00214E2C51|nr:protein TALPID3 isoform X6 [Epinephelus moara]
MSSRLASSSDRQPGSSGETSPDQSSCSSDTGDVLIRSTRVLPLDRGHEGKPGPGSGSVHITVQKLRDPLVQPPLSEQQQRSSGSEKRQQRLKPRQKPENAPPLRVVGHGQTDGLRKPGLTKENREPRRRQRPAAESSPDRKLSAGTHSDQQPGDDLLTSRFAAGGRGVVLAALKQRSHSAPHRREVRVQLLDPEPLRTSSQDAPAPSTSSKDAVGVAGVQVEAGLSSGCLRDATNAAAAAAAAAVAAAAPLIKAQSDMEARVCHLAEGVQRLLQADRDGGDRGRSLSQQTLHYLETLHSQQLQQQSQLLESALRMMTGHAPATRDLTASGQSPRLQVTHLDTAADVLSNQQQSSSATRTAAAAVETGPVAMATPYHDRWPEQTRDDWYRRGAPSVSTATQPAAGSHPQSSTSHSQAAARRANETLREMGRLKAEMKMLLTPEDSLITIRPGPDHHQAQQNLLQSQESHSNPNHLRSQSQQSKSQSQQSKSQSKQSKSQSQRSKSQSQRSHSQSEQSHSLSQQSKSQENLLQSQQSKSHQNHLQSSQSQSQQSKSQENLLQSQQSKSHQNHLQSSQSQSQRSHSQLQQSQSQESHSQYQQSRSLQNLLQSQQNHLESSAHQSHSQSQQSQSQESHSQYQQSRSQQSHAPCQQTELQQNQSQFQQVQSQQSPTHQTQPQLSQQSQSVVVQRRPVVPSMLEEAGLVLRQVQRQKKVLEENLEALLRAKTGEVLNCQLEAMAANRDWTEEVRIKKTVDAWISTLTKDIQAEMSSEDAALTSQQGAAGSSAHTGRGRPVSAPKGTGSKNVAGRGSRGQTSGHRALQGAEPDRATDRLAESDRESYLTRLYGRAPYEGLRRTLKKSPYLRFSSPASPLGRKPRPRLVESVTGRPRIDSSSRCLTERQQEVTSPPAALPESSMVAVDEGAPELQSQEEQQDASEVPPSPPPPPPPPPADIIEKKSEEEENEEDVFPGTDFLSVADIAQQEEVSVVGEEALELDGGPSPPPVLYQGPVFPPQAPSALPAQDQGSIPGLNPQTDALENRLVEWVEQQLMSRMISEMYRPPLSDPAQNDSTDQSESREQSVTSDIVEAAGGGGLQLFVDSNMSVDSALIRQLVNEVLAEHVALMLGQRDSMEPGPELEPEPGPGSHQEDKPVPLVPTPVPTPPPSPTPSSRETPILTTPPPSEPTSLLNEESPRPITAPEPVATPTSSPEPAPSAGSPPAAHQAPPSLTWGNAELPLDEERPEEHLDTRPQPLVMSVAQEEPPLSSPSLPSIPPALSPSPPPPPPPPPGPDPRPASPSSSSEDSSTSSTSSTSTVTAGTEAALKHISEGELLISVNQLAAMTEEEAVCSFSSSLQELQDMDFDPPSEGQVRGHELLLNKMEQRVTHPPRGERPQPEGAWGRDQEEEVSVGEVRDDWTTKPHRTTNPKSYSKSTAGQRDQTSPGQISQCADVSEGSLGATNQDLTMEPVGTLTSDLQTDLTLSPPPHLEDTHTAGQVVAVRPIHRQTAEQQQGGGGRVDVHLLSITPQEEEEEEEEEEVMEEVSAAADTESSSDDVF